MANEYFAFKRFSVWQQRCAMKVGTDGTLLGAWAECGAPHTPAGTPPHILDIGTGSGLIALMMAQRFPEAAVTAIDIDAEAVAQARINIEVSPFAARITVVQTAVQHFHPDMAFNSIVCNPPFFINSLECPDIRRAASRHASSLSYADLTSAAYRLLKPTGILSLVIPADCRERMESAAAIAGFFPSRACAVKTTPAKQPKRYLLAFAKQPPAGFSNSELVIGSDEYRRLTADFYLDR